MTEKKRFTTVELPKPNRWGIWYDGAYLSTYQVCILLNEYADIKKENEQLKQQIKDMSRFECTGEHIRLSINIETGELQRHIYATGQWFGDFDRVLVTNWLDEKTYQKFIDRVIEVYNTEFKGDDGND